MSQVMARQREAGLREYQASPDHAFWRLINLNFMIAVGLSVWARQNFCGSNRVDGWINTFGKQRDQGRKACPVNRPRYEPPAVAA